MVTRTGQSDRITIRLPIEVRNEIDKIASDRYMKPSAYARMVLVNHVKNIRRST